MHERLLLAGSRYALRVVAGDGQTGPAGSLLAQPVQVEVRDAAGVPVRATIVGFRVTAGGADGAVVLDTLSVTNDAGVAQAELRLGTHPGAVEVRAFPAGVEDRSVIIRATATEGPAISGLLPANVGPGDTLAIAGTALGGVASTVEFGGVRARPASGSAGELRVVVPDCLPAGSVNVRVLSGTAWTAARTVTFTPRRRPLALQPYAAVIIGADELATCATIAADGNAEYVVIPQLASHAVSPVSTTMRVTAGGATLASRFRAVEADEAFAATSSGMRAQVEFDSQMRAQEWRLAPLARGAASNQPPVIPLTVGSLRSFHVITTQAGDAFTMATGRLRFVGDHLAIYVDTVAASSYDDADLARLGHLFDTDLYHTAVDAFGAESDFDGNGKVLVLLTPRVNALVASADCGQKGFITGFFYGRDLLTTAANSNAGEIFYALVPDTTGQYSCAHTTTDVLYLVSGTFVHEMQHMISFFHHVVARGGDPEEPWLNEGLSHIAEELVSKVFEARYPAPLGRTSTAQLFPDSSAPFMNRQLLNSYVYLNSSANHSVTTFVGSGSLEERGAAWLFLRWLGDQKGESIYRRLVQTSLTGVANVEARAGEPFAGLFGDFSVAIWGDSIPGVARDAVSPRYRFTSRNLRQLMARESALAGFPNVFPVVPFRLVVGGFAEGPLIPGTMVYGSLGPFSPGQGGVVLSFTKQDGSALGGGDGAQLGILRVR